MENIIDLLAFEVKKEMADRYFGFRKRIENDTIAYTERLALLSLELENKIGLALVRLYILLQKKDLISSFTSLVGLPKGYFYDPYILEAPTIRKRVFSGQEYRGLTRKRAFKNMFFDNYDSLVRYIDEYRKTIAELTEEQETIREEINLFYQKNDIDSILGFIRRLDSPDSTVLSTMQPDANGGSGQGLSSQMRLNPPPPACEILPAIPALPAQKTIRRQLMQLVTAALKVSPQLDLKALTREKP